MRGADLISDLCDDVLVRILELLPDAGDAARTAALSRRWRGLWTRLPALRFDSGSRPEFSAGNGGAHATALRYVAFVDDALALRAAKPEPAVEHLAISFAVKRPVPPRVVVEAAQEWIHDAVRHAVRSFTLELHLPMDYIRKPGMTKEKSAMVLDGFAGSAKLETMRLALGGAIVQLPAAATFRSLTELTLEAIDINIASGDGRLLDRLLSSACCPQLQKLRLKELMLAWQDKFLLEACSLLEMSCEDVGGLGPYDMELRTPSLRVLRMVSIGVPGEFKISAPRLEEIVFLQCLPLYIEVDGELPCMRSLKVELYSHGYAEAGQNDFSISLLTACCTSVRCLDVDLHVTEREEEQELIDIIYGQIPHFPHVVSLAICLTLWELHSNRVGVAEILTKCSNLKYLCISNKMEQDVGTLELHNFLCDHPDYWKLHDISLARLQEVEFMGLAGTDCELRFMQAVLRTSTQLQKVTVSFDPEYMMKSGRDAIALIPPLRGGKWTPRSAYLSYEWKYCPE
ncbi:unnamed protein product [Urochloa decumbens]|uniref:F-box domain-containing protein n=1 Tax=Urochloa decumbens TaxID=240449 RepID=A0ABC9D1R8_9POAL